jgi:hypothetical protein
MLHEDNYLKSSVESISDREAQGARYQDKLTRRKLPVVN